MMKKVLLVLLLGFALAGCGTDPRTIAEADAIRQDAAADAAADAVRLVERQALSTDKVEAGRLVWLWVGRAGAIAAVLILVGLGIGLFWFFVGFGRSMSKWFEFRAGLIPGRFSDFPLLASYQGRGKVLLYNPNTGGKVLTDTRGVITVSEVLNHER